METPAEGQPQAPAKGGSDLFAWLAIGAGSLALAAWLAFAPAGPPSRPEPVEGKKRPPREFAFVPPRAAGIATGLKDYHGAEATASCAACHTTRPADTSRRDPATLRQFHQGLAMKHGDLACVACHNPGDGYRTLRLADGRAVPLGEPMRLCAQCHGPQFRDYQHGAHGGMAGFWDTSRGPRQRHACTACHDPHAPAYPKVRPARGPNDRFLPPSQEHGHE